MFAMSDKSRMYSDIIKVNVVNEHENKSPSSISNVIEQKKLDY